MAMGYGHRAMKGRNIAGQRRAMWFKRLHDKSNLWLVHNPALIRKIEGVSLGLSTGVGTMIPFLPTPSSRLKGEGLVLLGITGATAMEKAYSKYRNEYEKVLLKTRKPELADKAVLKMHRKYII